MNHPTGDRKKKDIARRLKALEIELEKLVIMLSGTDSLNEASYLRKAVAEIKRAMRTL